MECAKQDGRESQPRLGSVDDDLSWDPQDKLLTRLAEQNGPENLQPEGEIEDTEGAKKSGEESNIKRDSRGSSLTECGPLWEEVRTHRF